MADPTTPTRPTRSKRIASSQLVPVSKRKKVDKNLREQAVQLDRLLTLPTTPPASMSPDEVTLTEVTKTPLSSIKEAKLDGGTYLDAVPAEILENIARDMTIKETELTALFRSKHFHDSVSPIKSSTWHMRFLSRWDPPFIDKISLYCAAYQERYYILNHSIDYGIDGPRVGHQLTILVEMVLQTFKPLQNHLPPGTRSRNLEAFHTNQEWMRKLLTSPFLDYRGQVRGKPHMLFDALQTLFSFLLLSPRYDISKTVSFARSDYDITIVYNWDRDFKTLFKPLPQTQQDEPGHTAIDGGSSTSSDVVGPALCPVTKFRLDMYALLHIRNFWHRHMVYDQIESTSYFGTADDTFYRTVDKLTELGHVPKAWSSPLQDYEANLDAIVRGKWVGLYSTIRQWPNKEETMTEVQTDATDWCDSIDPLLLNFHATRNTNERTFGRDRTAVIWPNVFRDIACFRDTIPLTATEINSLSAARLGPVFFLQGFAPFMDIEAEIDAHQILNGTFDKKSRTKHSKSTSKKASATHPFNALRLRGVIHSLPTNAPFPDYLLHNNSPPTPAPLQLLPALPTPGFRRVALVLYKPSDIDLIKQLEFADENYGSAFAVSVTSQMNPATQAAYNAAANNSEDISEPVMALVRAHLAAMIEEREEMLLREAEAKKGRGGEGGAGDDAEPKELPGLTKEQKAAQDRRERNRLWTTEEIVALETGFHQSGQLDWNDMDWAYAYEGVVCPGGNVMMGRWWRVGLMGEGVSQGCEIDQAGEGVPTRVSDHATANGVGEGGSGAGGAGGAGGAAAAAKTGARKLERGPFVFWGMEE